MAKMTLLEMVQDILNDMDSDTANSISDHIEATQVAQIIKTTYFEIISGDRDWPHLKELGQLTASGDSEKPTHMTMSDNVKSIEYIKYDKRKAIADKKLYEDVTYMEPKAFLDFLNTRDSTADNVKTVTDDSGIDLLIRTDLQPTYWTSFDDETILFDSYYSDLDTTLQQSKTQILFVKEPTWSHTDSFTPDLPSKAFSFFLSEAKSAAFNAIKQSPNPKEEQRARRQKVYLSQKAFKTRGGIKRPNYGRK